MAFPALSNVCEKGWSRVFVPDWPLQHKLMFVSKSVPYPSEEPFKNVPNRLERSSMTGLNVYVAGAFLSGAPL